MDSIIAFVVIVIVLSAILYFKVPKVKEFIDSRFRRKPEIDLETIRGPFKPSLVDEGTPTPTPVFKPTPEPVFKPETPISVPIPEYNGIGDPPSQTAWAAWRSSLDPIRRTMTPEIWKPTPSSGDSLSNRYALVVPTKVEDKLIFPLLSFAIRVNAPTNVILSFPVSPLTGSFVIVPSGGGSGNKYNIWTSNEPGGKGNDKVEFNEVSSIKFSKDTKWVNLRNLGLDTNLFVQAFIA